MDIEYAINTSTFGVYIPMHIPFTIEEDQFLIDNYASLGPKICATSLKRCSGAIIHRRKKLGLPGVSVAVTNRLISSALAGKDFTRESHVRAATFEKVQTPEAAYILGVLWADGYVHPQKVVLTCLQTDAIEYTPTFLKTGAWRFVDVQYKGARPSRAIQLGHTELATYLISQGYQSKSRESACKILKTIPDNLKHYWWRGYFDGDGSIRYMRRGTSAVRISSSYEQDWTHMKILCDELNIRYSIYKARRITKEGKLNSSSTFCITYALGVKTFCDYIYQGRPQDKIGLSRKYLKWLDLVSYMKTRPKVGHLFR